MFSFLNKTTKASTGVIPTVSDFKKKSNQQV